jgi:hypothetical protein
MKDQKKMSVVAQLPKGNQIVQHHSVLNLAYDASAIRDSFRMVNTRDHLALAPFGELSV